MLKFSPMKILQLNIWGGKLGKQIIELLEIHQPDVVCFQEVVKLTTLDRLFFHSLGEYEKLGFQSFFSPVFGFTLMNQKAEFGNAILSKNGFSEQNTVFTRKEYVSDMDMLDKDYNIRNLQHVAVEHGGEKIHILNHHGHHIDSHKNGDEETMRQCKMIADYIKNLSGKIILCGDFNLAPESQSIGQINELLNNHCLNPDIKTTRTPLTHKTEVCDYIFTSKDIEVKSFAVLENIASDHAALLLEF